MRSRRPTLSPLHRYRWTFDPQRDLYLPRRQPHANATTSDGLVETWINVDGITGIGSMRILHDSATDRDRAIHRTRMAAAAPALFSAVLALLSGKEDANELARAALKSASGL